MSGDTVIRKVSEPIYTILNADGTLGALVTGIYDKPPDNTAHPYITIGEAFETRDDTFGKRGKDVLTSLHIWSRYNGFREALLIAERLILLLDEVALSVSGYDTVYVLHESTETIREQDKETRHVVVEFRIRVQQS